MAARRLLLASVGLFALAGCPSLSTMQTPSTVPKGDIRLGFSAHQVGFTAGDASLTVPQLEFTARYGATEDMDLGIKLFLAGAEAGLKYQFLRGPLDVAVAPSASYFGFSTTSTSTDSSGATTTNAGVSLTALHAPLLFGYNVTEKFTIGFGPKFLYIIASTSAQAGAERQSATDGGAFMGGFLNLPIRVGKAFWIAPELNMYKPVGVGTGAIIWQGGVAFLFGGAPAPTAPAGAIAHSQQ